ncbi:Flp pilus assembly protein TadB [Streptomyces sp. SAI-170]|uniref:hypothetical protein n=1 Tax=Streptomyces sp. SAI-170 TaxID=3377729 RepID=UPI003C79F3EE
MTSRSSPVRRRTRRTVRRQRADERLIGLLVAAGLAVAVVVTVVNWLMAHWWVLVVLGVLAVGAGIAWLHRVQLRARWEAIRQERTCAEAVVALAGVRDGEGRPRPSQAR